MWVPSAIVGGMTRQQEALALCDELLADIELIRTSTSAHVLKANRIARLVGDEQAQRWLGYELNGTSSTDEGRVWMGKTRRWTNKADGKGWWISAIQVESMRDSMQSKLAAFSAPVNVAGDWANKVMMDRAVSINGAANAAAEMDRILTAVDALIYGWVSDVHAELRYSQVQADLFEAARTDVDATLATMSGTALRSVDSISERLRSGDETAVSQAMTTCRQLIDSVADHVFPPSDAPYQLGEQALVVKADKVLNRLNAYVHSAGVTGGHAARIRRTLSDLYDRVSASVHKPDVVTPHEARYLFLAVYSTLGEILTLAPAQEDE